jgi:hypothetical protein
MDLRGEYMGNLFIFLSSGAIVVGLGDKMRFCIETTLNYVNKNDDKRH